MATDKTNPLPSITEPVIDRNRYWNPVWYRWIKPLIETVRTTANLMDTVTVDVDQVKGFYGVSVNSNGRVTASIKLDGTPADSSFAILADKFIVVHPSVNATEIQAFIIGLVDGVSTVGINGDLLVDGTIVARHLDVTSLSAITADLGTVTAGKMQSKDGKMVINLDLKTITITT